MMHERKLAFDSFVLAKVSISESCTDANLALLDFNATQLRKVPNTDQFPRRKLTGCILHHHIGTARNRKPLAWFVGQQRDDRVQAARRDNFIVGWIRPHAIVLRRAAPATASTIWL